VSYSQTCSDTKLCGTPAQKKLERPIFHPRDRGEVFWNITLLSIEQISSLLQSKWVQGITSAWRHYACHCFSLQGIEQQKAMNNYWQRNSKDGDELHSVGTLARTVILAHKLGIHCKKAIKYGMTCKLA